MGAAVEVRRTDHTAIQLRGLAAKSDDGAQVRRLLALALILEGQSRHVAAERCGMDRQTLRDWVHRYNAEGVPGLVSIRTGGHAGLLSEAQMAELKDMVTNGPDPETDGVVRWRCIDLRDAVSRRFAVTVDESTIGKWLRKNITLLSLPPYAPELNPMENVWEYLRANKLCALVWDSYEAIVDACRKAWQFLTDDPDRIRSIGTREWATVSG